MDRRQFLATNRSGCCDGRDREIASAETVAPLRPTGSPTMQTPLPLVRYPAARYPDAVWSL